MHTPKVWWTHITYLFCLSFVVRRCACMHRIIIMNLWCIIIGEWCQRNVKRWSDMLKGRRSYTPNILHNLNEKHFWGIWFGCVRTKFYFEVVVLLYHVVADASKRCQHAPAKIMHTRRRCCPTHIRQRVYIFFCLFGKVMLSSTIWSDASDSAFQTGTRWRNFRILCIFPHPTPFECSVSRFRCVPLYLLNANYLFVVWTSPNTWRAFVKS